MMIRSSTWMAGLLLLTIWLQACSTVKPAPSYPAGPAVSAPPAAREPAPPPPGWTKPYQIDGTWYHPLNDANGFAEEGLASWYGEQFHGRRTSNGEIYDMYGVSAAHKTLPLGTYVRVHNLANDRTLDVRINDRGPFVRGRIIDLSYSAAKALGVLGPGTAPVRIEALGAPESGPGQLVRYRPLDYFSGNFTFQVGAFAERANAERLVQKLGKQYENAHMVTYFDGSRTLYRVRVGQLNKLEQAEQFERRLVEEGYTGAFIVAE